MINTFYQSQPQPPTSGLARAANAPNNDHQAQQAATQRHGAEVNLSDEAQLALSRSRNKTEGNNDTPAPVSLHDLAPIELFNQADVEAYDEHLMETLASRGIDTSKPIDFGFTYDGRVTVKNDHPDKAAIEAAFAEDMDLRNGLVQTSNFYMFQELSSLNQQWAEKLASGISEEVAGQWLVNAAKSATAKNAQGISYSGGSSQDPFSSQSNHSLASRAYGA